MRGVNPSDAGRTLKTLLDVWDAAAEKMLDTVAKRLARGITEPGWAEGKAREVLLVRAELRAIVEQYLAAGLEEHALTALADAYAMGENVAATLDQVAIDTNPLKVAQLTTRFVTQMQGTFLPVIRAHEDVFQKAISETETLMQTGTITRREAIASSVDRLIADGQDRFTDSAGRKWHLDSYVRMAGRTAAQQTAVEGQLDGMVARGRDLVMISDSPRECATCRPWERALLSVTGASVGQKVDGRVVSATVAEARLAGLWHPNCSHRADPFVPGFTQVSEPKEDPEGYANSQKLRRLEREARELKRRLLAAQQLGDTQTARELRKKIRAKGAQITAHTEQSGLLRRRDREKPIGG